MLQKAGRRAVDQDAAFSGAQAEKPSGCVASKLQVSMAQYMLCHALDCMMHT